MFEYLIFMIIVIIFVCSMLLLFNRIENNSSYYERVYSKKIALLIDRSKPDTNIELDISNLMELASKSKIDLINIVKIDNTDKSVRIKLTNSKGYKFHYFSAYNILWDIKTDEKKLVLEVKE